MLHETSIAQEKSSICEIAPHELLFNYIWLGIDTKPLTEEVAEALVKRAESIRGSRSSLVSEDDDELIKGLLHIAEALKRDGLQKAADGTNSLTLQSEGLPDFLVDIQMQDTMLAGPLNKIKPKASMNLQLLEENRDLDLLTPLQESKDFSRFTKRKSWIGHTLDNLDTRAILHTLDTLSTNRVNKKSRLAAIRLAFGDSDAEDLNRDRPKKPDVNKKPPRGIVKASATEKIQNASNKSKETNLRKILGKRIEPIIRFQRPHVNEKSKSVDSDTEDLNGDRPKKPDVNKEPPRGIIKASATEEIQGESNKPKETNSRKILGKRREPGIGFRRPHVNKKSKSVDESTAETRFQAFIKNVNARKQSHNACSNGLKAVRDKVARLRLYMVATFKK